MKSPRPVVVRAALAQPGKWFVWLAYRMFGFWHGSFSSVTWGGDRHMGKAFASDAKIEVLEGR
jgi:hypothetical protein